MASREAMMRLRVEVLMGCCSVVVLVRRCRSVAIADTPDGARCRGRQATLSDCLRTLLLSDHLLGVLCHDGAHVEFGLGHFGRLN